MQKKKKKIDAIQCELSRTYRIHEAQIQFEQSEWTEIDSFVQHLHGK